MCVAVCVYGTVCVCMELCVCECVNQMKSKYLACNVTRLKLASSKKRPTTYRALLAMQQQQLPLLLLMLLLLLNPLPKTLPPPLHLLLSNWQLLARTLQLTELGLIYGNCQAIFTPFLWIRL